MAAGSGASHRRRGAFAPAAIVALALPAALALALPGAAGAATVIAGPAPLSYANSDIAITAGESLEFLNLDLTAPHDVTSTDVGEGAEPLFRSATVGFPSNVPVTGAEDLGAGVYPFICSIHSFMTGTVTVTGGNGAGGGDGKAPKVSLKGSDSSIGKVLRRGALRVKVKTNEAATVRLRASADGTRIAARRARLKRGTSKLKLKLNGAGERLLRKSSRLEVRVAAKATDAAGNSRTARETLALD